VLLKAATEELLKQLISEYRLRNNLPMGDLEREIDDYYCGKYPQICSKEAKDYFPDTTVQSAPRETMLNRVSRWAAWLKQKMPRGGYPLVVQATADERARICSACPKNVPWRGGCSGCSSAVLTLLAQLRQLRVTRQHTALMGCSVAGWENGCAVWHENATLELTGEQIAALPTKCWRKQ
jgi:hypothetical protein